MILDKRLGSIKLLIYKVLSKVDALHFTKIIDEINAIIYDEFNS